ncbi:MAG TPA: hypothetical protein VGG89_15060 [Candidatus Baltobacteraceae bacterium]
MKQKLLVSPFPDMHLATIEWHGGTPRPKPDETQRILYSTKGNDTAQLFLVNELYDLSPTPLVDLNLQSWTFGMRKAQLLRGNHYLFWSEAQRIAAIMASRRTARVDELTFIPVRLKPRPKRREPFPDLSEVPGTQYLERLTKYFADDP